VEKPVEIKWEKLVSYHHLLSLRVLSFRPCLMGAANMIFLGGWIPVSQGEAAGTFACRLMFQPFKNIFTDCTRVIRVAEEFFKYCSFL
jgi:hypothetical protein